jgi:O-antigen ligase
MTFTSLSSGPLLAVALQIIMIGWGWITRNAWWALIGLAVIAYVAIDLLSNRTPVQVLISYLTFSPANAYTRLAIWNFGSAEVLRHPLFGIGLNNWERPSWMTSSVDNFWLATAMRYGLPGVLLLMAGIAANLVQIIRADLPDRLKPVRDGYVIATVGTLMVLSTVHVWGSAAALILFYFGAGNWMFGGGAAAEATDDAAAGAEPVAESAKPEPAAPAALSARRGPSKAERLARRQAQYSRPRP